MLPMLSPDIIKETIAQVINGTPQMTDFFYSYYEGCDYVQLFRSKQMDMAEFELVKKDIHSILGELENLTKGIDPQKSSISLTIQARGKCYRLAHLFAGLQSEASGGDFINDYQDEDEEE